VLPLFSVKLREIRGKTSVSAMANLCNVSRETIRLVESGEQAPSNTLLFNWLRVKGLEVRDFPDLLASVSKRREETNKWIREYVELKSLCSGGTNIDRESILQDFRQYLLNIFCLEETQLPGQMYHIERILDKYTGTE
jgi:transcriptional regulator with XRE-family HTH domain